ncbi:MAG TPA: GNAT family N-acetyltransferase, partial [Actinotalea sp.]|nr:GNAT family N-acetyltransferase [Actinotalea sp.]
MRPTVVRTADPDDIPRVVDLCLAVRRESMVGNQVCTPDPEAVARQLRALAGSPGGVVMVAAVEDEAVGVLLGRILPPNPFQDVATMVVEAVYVGSDHRRRGVGHSLMAGATDLADQAGVVDVYAAPIPGARGMQRFFVQLGFTPAAAHRFTTLAALRRRLAADPGRSGRRTVQRGLEDLIARRRQTRAVTGEIPVVRVGPDGRPPRAEPGQGERDRVREVRTQPGASTSMHVSRAVHSRREAEATT